MSNKRGRSPRLELTMNLSPPREATSVSSNVSLEFSTSSSISIQSLESSSVSSVAEEPKAMLLVGCPQCLIYVMLSEVNPKCPKCKSTVLLDFLNNQEKNKKTSS